MCTWIYQQDPNGMGTWTYLYCPENMGGPTYSSRSSVPTDLDIMGKAKNYLDYIYPEGLSSIPILVAVVQI